MHHYSKMTYDCLDKGLSSVTSSKSIDADYIIAPSLLQGTHPGLKNFKISIAQFLSLASGSTRILQEIGFRGWAKRHFDRGDISSYSVHYFTQRDCLMVDFSQALGVTITLAPQPENANEDVLTPKELSSAALLVALLKGTLRDSLLAIPYALNIKLLDACRMARKVLTFALDMKRDLWHGADPTSLFEHSNINSVVVWGDKEPKEISHFDLTAIFEKGNTLATNLHRQIATAVSAPTTTALEQIQEGIDTILDALSFAALLYAVAGTSMSGVFSIIPVEESTIPFKPELQSLHNFLVSSARVSSESSKLHMPQLCGENEYLLATEKNALFYLNQHYARLYKNQNTKMWSDPAARAFVARQRLISILTRWYAFVLFGYDLTNSMGYFGDPADLQTAIARTQQYIVSQAEYLESLFPTGTIDQRVVTTAGTNQDGKRMSLGSLVNYHNCIITPQSSKSLLFRPLSERPQIMKDLGEVCDTRTATMVKEILDRDTRLFTVEVNSFLSNDVVKRLREGLTDILPLDGKVFLSIRIKKNTAFPDQYSDVYLIQVIGGALA